MGTTITFMNMQDVKSATGGRYGYLEAERLMERTHDVYRNPIRTGSNLVKALAVLDIENSLGDLVPPLPAALGEVMAGLHQELVDKAGEGTFAQATYLDNGDNRSRVELAVRAALDFGLRYGV